MSDIILAADQQSVHGMADFFRKVWALGKAGVDVPLRILQGAQIRDIVVHSTTRNLYRQPEQGEMQTGVKLVTFIGIRLMGLVSFAGSIRIITMILPRDL